MQNSRPVGVPTGASIVGAYGSGIAPANYGPGGTRALASASRAVGGTDYRPPFDLDPRHCSHTFEDEDGNEKQCMGWPVKDEDKNPDRLCVGHLKQAEKNGAEPPADS